MDCSINSPYTEMKRYESYKDSGVEWIGEIPSHWNCQSGNTIGTYSKGKGIRKDEVLESGFPCIRYGEIYTRYNHSFDKTYSFISQESTHNSFQVETGSILITGSGETSEEIGKSIVYLGDETIWAGGDIIVLKTDNGKDPSFINYTINSENLRIQRQLAAKGEIVVHIYPKNFKEMKFPIPPISEQHQIVTFLDNKTAKIDDLIQKKERKIVLLKEYRTALINKVVTKGLNPDVEMKDSGVEWIGMIPRNWSISKLGLHTTKIGSGSTPRGGSEVYVEKGIPFLRSQNIHFHGLSIDDISYIDEDTHNGMANTKVRYGDILLNITGGSIGRCCIMNLRQEMNVNQHVCIIRTKDYVNNYFLNYQLGCDTGQLQVRLNLTGGNREGLTIDGIRAFIVTMPPLSEQNDIVSYLDTETQKIEKSISLEEKKIELLKEYRKSLISNVVTGKVDVRSN